MPKIIKTEKICIRCKENKPINLFYKDKQVNDGYGRRCIECTRILSKEKYKKDSIKIKKRVKKYATENPNKIKQQRKNYKLKNQEKVKKTNSEKYYKNREKVLRQQKEYMQRPEIKSRYNQHCNNRYKNDIQFKLKVTLRNRINGILKIKDIYKTFQSHIDSLGCTILELKIHLESQFKQNMTWQNHSKYGWHIDHIKPLSSFDLTDPEQVKQACHYTNLQPLWAQENILKGNKII